MTLDSASGGRTRTPSDVASFAGVDRPDLRMNFGIRQLEDAPERGVGQSRKREYADRVPPRKRGSAIASQSEISPRIRASATASVRVLAPSLSRALCAYERTVSDDRLNRSAIAGPSWPCASRLSTCRSR